MALPIAGAPEKTILMNKLTKLLNIYLSRHFSSTRDMEIYRDILRHMIYY